MKPGEVLRELERLARRMGVDVRFVAFDEESGGRGGLCKLRGKAKIVVDESASVLEQVAVLETALGKLDLDSVFAPPFVRARIESRRAESGATGPAVGSATPQAAPQREGMVLASGPTPATSTSPQGGTHAHSQKNRLGRSRKHRRRARAHLRHQGAR